MRAVKSSGQTVRVGAFLSYKKWELGLYPDKNEAY